MNRFNKHIQKSIPHIGWLICILGAVFYSYEYFLRIAPNVMIGELMSHFHANAASLGIMSAAYYYAYTPMQLPVGLLMDRFGPRKLLTFACFICVLGTYLFILSNNLYIAALGRAGIGFGSAFAFVGVLKLATIWLPPNRLAMFAGFASALGTLGGAFGEIVLTDLVLKIGWQETLRLSALFGIALTVLLWLIISDQKPTRSQSQTTKSRRHQYLDFRRLLRDSLHILKNKQIWINGLISCLIYLPTTVFAELWGIRYLEIRGFTAHEAALGISTLYLGYTLGAPLIGILSDRLKRRKLPVIIGTIGTTILFSILLYVDNLSKTAIMCLLFSLGPLYGAHVIAFAIGREISPEKASGTAIAVTNMIIMMGAAVCQPLVGILLDYQQNLHDSASSYTPEQFQYALSIIPIGLALSAILSFFLRETHCKPLQQYKAINEK